MLNDWLKVGSAEYVKQCDDALYHLLSEAVTQGTLTMIEALTIKAKYEPQDKMLVCPSGVYLKGSI